MSTGPLRIVHGVLNLDVGGLERIVISLAEQTRANGHTVMIICVDRPGTLADQANHSGIEVHDHEHVYFDQPLRGVSRLRAGGWALSKPVVVPAVGALPEVIQYGVEGRLYPENDLQAFFTLVLQLVTDREQAEKMGLAGQRHMEVDFTIQRVSDKYIGVYREVLQSRAGVTA